MNIAFVFFITIGLLIIILSIFDVSMNAKSINVKTPVEGYTNINPNDWDIQALRLSINNLRSRGINYNVTNFTDHLNMLVNHFESLIKIGGTRSGDFSGVNGGKCYADDGRRYLPYRGGISAQNRRPDPPKRGWPGTNRYKNWVRDRDNLRRQYTNPSSPDFMFSLQNNYNKCKDYANRNGLNTFGLQYGTECWAGNTDNNMVINNRRLIEVKQNACTRGGFALNAGGPWTMNVYKKTTVQLKTIANYEEIITNFVKNGLRNDAEVMRANNLNMSGFTTMEGFIEGITTASPTQIPPYGGISPDSLFVSNANKIKVKTNKNVSEEIVTDNIIDVIVKNNYKIEINKFKNFITRFHGKRLVDVDNYITKNIRFGIVYDSLYAKMVTKLISVSPNSDQYADPEKLITNLEQFGAPPNQYTKVIKLNDIYLTNPPTGQTDDGWLIKFIKDRGLSIFRIQLLPSTLPGIGSESILSKLQTINSSIKTVGIMTNGEYAFKHFFTTFHQIYSINGPTFFIEIYPIYSDPSLKIYDYNNSNMDPLTDALSKIALFSPKGLVDAFKNIKEFLGPNGLNLNFNEYVKFLNDLISRNIKYNCSIIDLWKRFKEYYGTIAFSTAVTSKILPSNLIDMIDQISRNSTNYFKGGDFYEYLKILIVKKYQLSRVLEDVSLGKTFKEFLEVYNLQQPIIQQGFAVIHKPEPDFFQYLTDGFNSFFGINTELEGLETIMPEPTPIRMESDTVVLTTFGITDFNAELKSVEDTLFKYNVQEIGPSNTRWRNIVNIIDKLTKVSININNLNEFIELMVKFGADSIKKWYDVLNELLRIQIKGFANIKEFIELIIKFGINYSNKFKEFINVIVTFKADLSTSLNTVRIFVEDMMYVGYKYDTNSMQVNNIIYYFLQCRYTLDSYSNNNAATYSRKECTTSSKTLPPSGLPRKIVRSFYEYKSPNLQNDLFDIRVPSLLRNIPFCDIIDSMQQAYMIASPKTTSYNDATQNFIPHATKIIAFFYKDEFENIVKNPNAYQDYSKRVEIIRKMALGITAYTKLNTTLNKNDYKLYISLSKTMHTFPVICFQYLSNIILSMCGNNNNECDLVSLYVDPSMTYSKAIGNGGATNYRDKGPIL